MKKQGRIREKRGRIRVGGGGGGNKGFLAEYLPL
jgi:hypothetical protein